MGEGEGGGLDDDASEVVDVGVGESQKAVGKVM